MADDTPDVAQMTDDELLEQLLYLMDFPLEFGDGYWRLRNRMLRELEGRLHSRHVRG